MLGDCWESNSVNWRTQNDFEGALAIGWEAGIRAERGEHVCEPREA